jgi:hypothetical protein
MDCQLVRASDGIDGEIGSLVATEPSSGIVLFRGRKVQINLEGC